MITALGDRMKEYEKAYNIILTKRLPIIIRVDGKAFHTLLRNIDEPFDEGVKRLMDSTAIKLVEEIQGAVFAFVQSDEINILVVDYSSLNFCPWFGNELQKISSVSASIATSAFNSSLNFERDGFDSLQSIRPPAHFDSRCFILPKEEVCNYFIWRQQDWTRNSVQMLSRTLYSQNQVHGKNNEELQEMIFQKGLNWNDLESWKKRGRCFYRCEGNVNIDDEPPIFTQDRDYVEKHVFVEVDDDKNSG
jgi:tRNA(His) 5'-end guanylyltransferase